MSKIKQFSINILRKHPVKLATISCGVFGVGGDLLCQRLEWNWFKNNDTLGSYDLTRTAQFALNASLYGPFNYYWYRFLDRRYPTRNPRDMAKKIFIDLGFALVYYPIWFTTYSIIKTGHFEPVKLKKDMYEKIPVLLSFDIVLWPVLQWVNFKYLGPEYRVIGTKCSELVFDVIMSYVGNNDITLEGMIDYMKSESGRKTKDDKNDENSKSK